MPSLAVLSHVQPRFTYNPILITHVLCILNYYRQAPSQGITHVLCILDYYWHARSQGGRQPPWYLYIKRDELEETGIGKDLFSCWPQYEIVAPQFDEFEKTGIGKELFSSRPQHGIIEPRISRSNCFVRACNTRVMHPRFLRTCAESRRAAAPLVSLYKMRRI